jgi:hypothetical protein
MGSKRDQAMSSVWTIEEAVIAAFNNDAEWLALCGGKKMYSSAIPEGAEVPYGTIGDVNESGTRTSINRSRSGFDNQRWIHFYSDENGKEKCSQMYRIARRLLDGQKLTLGEGRMIRGELSLVAMTPDPSGSGEHGIASYETVSRND